MAGYTICIVYLYLAWSRDCTRLQSKWLENKRQHGLSCKNRRRRRKLREENELARAICVGAGAIGSRARSAQLRRGGIIDADMCSSLGVALTTPNSPNLFIQQCCVHPHKTTPWTTDVALLHSVHTKRRPPTDTNIPAFTLQKHTPPLSVYNQPLHNSLS